MMGIRNLLTDLGKLVAYGPTLKAVGREHQAPCLHQVILVDGYNTPNPLPPPIARNAQAARAACPKANYRLWNGDELRVFLAERFDRDVLAAFETLTPYSYKCDLARFCLLYELGGTYVDLGVRLLKPWMIPTGRSIAAFRDLPFITTSWTAMQTGLLWALPGQREFLLAIDLILGNVRTRYYGSGPLHPTGPVLLGKAMQAAAAERGWDEADPQHIGLCQILTPGGDTPNMGYVSPEGALIALRTKQVPGDLNHLGITGGNNYNQLWRTRRAYRERSWSFPIAKVDGGGFQSADCSYCLQLTPSCNLLEGAYEVLLDQGDVSSGSKATVEVRSLLGGDGAVLARASDRAIASMVVPFVVTRREDEIECRVEAPAGWSGALITIREAATRQWVFDDPEIRLAEGVRTEAGIAVAGASGGMVSFGPYITLFRGRYRLDVAFEAVDPSPGELNVEVWADAGGYCLASITVPASQLAPSGTIRLAFECRTDARAVEFRIHTRRLVHALLTNFALTRME